LPPCRKKKGGGGAEHFRMRSAGKNIDVCITDYYKKVNGR
jgi:hypothetical protein